MVSLHSHLHSSALQPGLFFFFFQTRLAVKTAHSQKQTQKTLVIILRLSCVATREYLFLAAVVLFISPASWPGRPGAIAKESCSPAPGRQARFPSIPVPGAGRLQAHLPGAPVASAKSDNSGLDWGASPHHSIPHLLQCVSAPRLLC